MARDEQRVPVTLSALTVDEIYEAERWVFSHLQYIHLRDKCLFGHQVEKKGPPEKVVAEVLFCPNHQLDRVVYESAEKKYNVKRLNKNSLAEVRCLNHPFVIESVLPPILDAATNRLIGTEYARPCLTVHNEL